MICETCAKTADLNRKLYKNGRNQPGRAIYPHPHNCGCECQHRNPEKWDSFFSVKEPNGEASTTTD